MNIHPQRLNEDRLTALKPGCQKCWTVGEESNCSSSSSGQGGFSAEANASPGLSDAPVANLDASSSLSRT